MIMSDHKISIIPAGLSPKVPAYWDAIAERARGMLARFEEEEKPQKLTYALGWGARTVVVEALDQAKQHLGTNRNAKALAHLCMDYLQHGPKVRAMESVALKGEIRKMRVEELMEQMGPDEVTAAFNRVFPARTILDDPK